MLFTPCAVELTRPEPQAAFAAGSFLLAGKQEAQRATTAVGGMLWLISRLLVETDTGHGGRESVVRRPTACAPLRWSKHRMRGAQTC